MSKEFKVTEDFIKRGIIHCNSKEEMENFKQWIDNNRYNRNYMDKYDNNDLYMIRDDLFYIITGKYYEKDEIIDDGYNIIEWTDYMDNNEEKQKELKEDVLYNTFGIRNDMLYRIVINTINEYKKEVFGKVLNFTPSQIVLKTYKKELYNTEFKNKIEYGFLIEQPSKIISMAEYKLIEDYIE